MAALLELRSLTVELPTAAGWVKPVNEVSLQIAAGETLGLVGESGSGKTMLSLALMGLLPAGARIAGEARLTLQNGNAKSLAALSEEQWRAVRGREIAMIFQEPMTSLNPVMRVGAQIEEAILAHESKLSREELRRSLLTAMQHAAMPEPDIRAQQYPHQLSGGLRQRAMIAMALAPSPKLLIADEPTTALDVTVQKQILDLLDRLRRELQLALLFITHDLAVVANVADRVAVMYAGRIVEEGPVQKVLTAPLHPYTQGLLNASPTLEPRTLTPIPGTVPRLTELPAGCAFAPRCSYRRTECDQRVPDFSLRWLHPWRAVRAGMSPLLQARNLRKSFARGASVFGDDGKAERFVAVNDVNFDVAAGETFAVVGESGCGKTTLARMVLRLIEPDHGELLFEGRDLLKLRGEELRAQRRQMQMIFQDPFASLNPRMTVGEIVAEPLAIHEPQRSATERAARATEMLRRVGLDESALKRYPHEFSGGQRQRIGIARALILRPKLVVADEPVSALDVSVGAQVLLLLQELQREFQLAFLFISHSLPVVAQLATHIAVMHAGQFVEQGPATRILQQPTQPYTRDLLAAVPELPTHGRV